MVIGGIGFPGYHFCDDQAKEGDDVLCVENFFTGGQENVVRLFGVTDRR